MAVNLLHKSYLNVDGTTYTIRDPEALHVTDADTFFHDDYVKAALLDLIHPVGSLYISDDSTDPGILFGGIWTQLEDMFILAAGSNHAVLSEGGYEDAVAISHTHDITISCSTDGAHTHAVTGTASSAGAHTHGASGWYFSVYKGTRSTEQVGAIGGTGFDMTQVAHSGSWGGFSKTASAGAHTHTVAGTAASAGGHYHVITPTLSSAGVSGTGRNMPPYHTSYVWKRTV